MRKKHYIYILLAILTTLLVINQPSIFLDRQITEALAQIPTPTSILSLAPDFDSSVHTLKQLPRLTNPQASQTSIIYQLPVVKFRVDSGDDLDQYLDAASSPLDFYIDLQGFTPPITQSTKVTLKVWDVDETGNSSNPDCLVEVDKVYVNDIYLGNLTGADLQWSWISFTIPADTLTDGKNHFWIEIDTLTSNCWAVKVDWAEVEIPFNIAQIEASTYYDIKIKRGTSDDIIANQIWQTKFDSNGNLLPATPNDPIADKIVGSWFFNWGAREFD